MIFTDELICNENNLSIIVDEAIKEENEDIKQNAISVIQQHLAIEILNNLVANEKIL